MIRLVFALILSLAGLSTALAAPQLVMERISHDFGVIRQGDKIDQVFRFHNKGDQVLQLSNLRSSCGCTAALLTAKRIAPGEIGELRLNFDSSGFSGRVNKIVQMDTNDPLHPRVTVNIHGNIKVDLRLSPERITLQNQALAGDGPVATTVILTNNSEKIIRLQPPRSSNPVIDVKLNQTQLDPGGQARLDVEVRIPSGEKRVRGYILIDTDYSWIPQVRIPVSLQLQN